MFGVALLSGPGCFLPPDAPPADTHAGFPPEVDLGSLQPPEPVRQISVQRDATQPCVFRVRVGQIRDLATRALRLRWVADNRTALANLILETDLILGPEGTGAASLLTDPGADFVGPLVGSPHALSLFITDASAWAVAEADIATSQETDLGLIKSSAGDGGLPAAHVIEVRWVFSFTQALGACPQ